MYDVSTSLYPLKLTDFVKKVKGVFILNGAFCYINKTRDSSTAIPTVINSTGFNYTSSVAAVVVPTVTDLTTENMIIHFTFYKKYDDALPEDISGKIYFEDGQYVLHIDHEVTIIDILKHNDFKLRLTQAKPITVEILRDILAKVRGFYMLANLDKLNDVLPVPTDMTEVDDIVSNIKKYLAKAEDHGYLLDMCVQSTTDIIDKNILSISIKYKENSRAKLELVKIDLSARIFEPSIILSTNFRNQDDKLLGTFKFLDATDTEYLIAKALTQDEANLFTKKIIAVVSEFKSYHFVTDVTP